MIPQIIGAGLEIFKGVLGYKQSKEDQYFAQFRGTQDELASEFGYRTNRTWWDSLWDGLNRAPRPIIVAMIIAYFLASWMAPEQFNEINIGLASIPENMWWIASAIITFYFAAREFKYSRDMKVKPPKIPSKPDADLQQEHDPLDRFKPNQHSSIDSLVE